MDICCGTCNEPYDAYHMRHEAIKDIDGLPNRAIEAWAGKLDRIATGTGKSYRWWFKQDGWQFGGSVYSIFMCPCCPPGTAMNVDAAELRGVIEDALDGDEDALASIMYTQ